MSSKIRRQARLNKTPKKAPIHMTQKMNGTPIKNRITEKKTKKRKSLVQSNPKLTMLILVIIYFLLDYLMMDTTENLQMSLIIIFTLLAPSTLYSYYVNDYHCELNPTGGTDMPAFVKDKKKYAILGWLVITLWGIIFIIIEPMIVPRFFPVLNDTYHQSQIMLMLYVAPVMEEIIFRYLLYDRWLRRKWGWFGGFLAASFIFVICHPVTNIHAVIVYWVPTVLFFLVYHEFGLYGSIIMHMLYNMMAI